MLTAGVALASEKAYRSLLLVLSFLPRGFRVQVVQRINTLRAMRAYQLFASFALYPQYATAHLETDQKLTLPTQSDEALEVVQEASGKLEYAASGSNVAEQAPTVYTAVEFSEGDDVTDPVQNIPTREEEARGEEQMSTSPAQAASGKEEQRTEGQIEIINELSQSD